MSAKQIKVEFLESQGQEIPINSKLEKDSFSLYPFAFVSTEEIYMGKEIE